MHLGTPDQYEDFIKWRNEIKKNYANFSILKSSRNYKTFMLMAGKGSRLKKIKKRKIFITL